MAKYATAEELRSFLNMERDAEDVELEMVLATACSAIDRFCHRSRDGFLAAETATAREFVGRGRVYVFIDECVEISKVEVKPSVTEDYVEWEATDWLCAWGDPAQPHFERTPFTVLLVNPGGQHDSFTNGRTYSVYHDTEHGYPTVRVTARWGYAVEVPDEVHVAVMMQAARWWKRLGSNMADTVGNEMTGQMYYRQRLDADVAFLLEEAGLRRVSE